MTYFPVTLVPADGPDRRVLLPAVPRVGDTLDLAYRRRYKVFHVNWVMAGDDPSLSHIEVSLERCP